LKPHKITQRHIEIAHSLTAKFLDDGRNNNYYDDYFSEALGGLEEANRRYKDAEDGRGSFDAFCIKIAKERIIRYYKCYLSYKKRDVNKTVLSENNPQEYFVYTENKINKFETKQVLKKVLKNVSPRTRAIMYMRNYDYTLDECGKRYGLSRERVRQIEDDGLKKARKRAALIGVL